MRRCFIVMIALIISFLCLTASAEDAALNLLWGIPFDTDAYAVQDILQNERGIPCKYEYIKGNGLVSSHAEVNSTDANQQTLYGYNFNLKFAEKPGRFTITIRPSGSWEDRTAGIMSIVGGLCNRYGLPNDGRCELWSNGSISWRNQDAVAYHEIITLPTDSVDDLDPNAILDAWQYSQPSTELVIHLAIYNIRVEINCHNMDDDWCSVQIFFFDTPVELRKEPIFEAFTDPAPTRVPADSFDSDGF